MTQSSSQQWPMPEYPLAWKLFRDNADENEVTAQYLLKRPLWPQKGNLSICDLGCGDGRILAEIMSRCTDIQKVRLVDPNNDWLDEAEALIRGRFPELHLTSSLNSVRESWPKCADDTDVVLAVHLVYLLEADELHSLIHNRPKSAVTYVVFDSPTSVFSELWKWTACKYSLRAELAHTELCKYLGLSAPPRETVIRSRFPKKLLSNHELSDWLMSILCYRNMLTEVPADLKSKVQEIIDRHTDATGEFVECESVCYELPANKPR